MFSKMTLSVFVSGLSIMADYFSSAAFGCFSLSFFLMSIVMSCFPSMSLAWFTILRAFFTSPCNISLLSGLIVFWFWLIFWVFFEWLHSEINSSSFPCFHHSILFVQVFDMFCFLIWEMASGVLVAEVLEACVSLLTPIFYCCQRVFESPLQLVFF